MLQDYRSIAGRPCEKCRGSASLTLLQIRISQSGIRLECIVKTSRISSVSPRNPRRSFATNERQCRQRFRFGFRCIDSTRAPAFANAKLFFGKDLRKIKVSRDLVLGSCCLGFFGKYFEYTLIFIDAYIEFLFFLFCRLCFEYCVYQ